MQSSFFCFSVYYLSRFVCKRLHIIIRPFLHKYYHHINIMSNFAITKNFQNIIDIFITN